MNYAQNAKTMSNMNMSDFGTLVSVKDDGNWMLVDISAVDEFDEVDYEDTIFDEYEAREFMNMLVKDAPHYLVMAYNSRWDGASGYKFSHDKLDTIRRSYDVSIFPQKASRGGKVLVCSEASHDVPMGATTVIIALTEKEYDTLCGGNGVYEFAEKNMKKVS